VFFFFIFSFDAKLKQRERERERERERWYIVVSSESFVKGFSLLYVFFFFYLEREGLVFSSEL